MSNQETTLGGGPRPFPVTSWGMIRRCQDPASQARGDGLEALARRYWGPVYYFIRRNWSCPVDEAKDLTQGFFAALLETDLLGAVDADRGRFRNVVCAALQHFLCNRRRAAHALKRRPAGGLVSLDGMPGSQTRPLEPPAPEHADPGIQFEADWKRAVIDAALATFRQRAEALGKGPLVDLFVRYDLDRLPGEKLTYRELAASVGLDEAQVTSGLRWARRTFRQVFLDELRDQVESEDDLRREARELFGIDLEGAPGERA